MRTRIAFLGTGNPNPDPKHQGPSLSIIVNEQAYLVDFGVGLVRQAASLSAKYGGSIPALDVSNLRIGFLTHLHSDHILGYSDLIFTPWVMERGVPLTVYGPVGTQALTDHILRAYEADIHYRISGLEPINQLGWQVVVHEITEGLIYKDNNIAVEAFLVSHGTMQNAFGFRFTTPDKKIVISGDTVPCDNILKFSQGADILIHEVYSHRGFKDRDKSWQQYHRLHHTSTLQLGEIANITRPGLVVLYHTLFWGASEVEILAEVRSVYKGEVILSYDLLVIS